MFRKKRGSGRGWGLGGSESTGREKSRAGPGGECVCSKCGHRIPHVVGKPCLDIPCPRCGSEMVRRG